MFKRRPTLDFNERLSALENRRERYEDELSYAFTAHQVAEANERQPGV